MSQPARPGHGYRALAELLAVVALLALLPTSTATAQVADDNVISEIFYNPDGQDEGHEFIELDNPTSSPVDVSGWQFLAALRADSGQLSIDASLAAGNPARWVAGMVASDDLRM